MRVDERPCTNGLWRWEADGCLTPHCPGTLLSKKSYANFVLDCVYTCDETSNSGIFIYDTKHPTAKIEVQILDDHHPMYAKELPYQLSGSLYGRCPASQVVSKPIGQENRMTIWAEGDRIRVVLNDVQVIDADLRQWTSQTVNPDGTPIPKWHHAFVPWAQLPRYGRIGLQGVHGGKAVHFKYLRVKKLD